MVQSQQRLPIDDFINFGKMSEKLESSNSLSVLSSAMRAARTEDKTENRETQLIL